MKNQTNLNCTCQKPNQSSESQILIVRVKRQPIWQKFRRILKLVGGDQFRVKIVLCLHSVWPAYGLSFDQCSVETRTRRGKNTVSIRCIQNATSHTYCFLILSLLPLNTGQSLVSKQAGVPPRPQMSSSS